MMSENFLDGCRHVFLDMGTNTDVQIRKLYEPHLFPNASVLPIFDKITPKLTNLNVFSNN